MSGEFVQTFNRIAGLVDRAAWRLFSRREVTEVSEGTVTVKTVDPAQETERYDTIPMLRFRPPHTGDRIVVLNAPALGGMVGLGVVGGDDDDLIQGVIARLDALEAKVATLEASVAVLVLENVAQQATLDDHESRIAALEP